MERAFPDWCEEPPNLAIDRCIGERIRAKRLAMGVSQSGLGDALGVSFQQVQKYENGMNRIGAGQLAAICSFLDLEPNQLFHKLIDGSASGAFSGAQAPAVAAISRSRTS